jgi:uncharacterized membrane protein
MLLAILVVLLLVAPASLAVSPRSLTLRVYSDGYVSVAQTIPVSEKASSIQVSLLSSMVSGLVATDQNGSPLSYGFSKGTNITVYTLGATLVNLRYDTDSLTGKNGTVWTLTFSAQYNSTVILPQYSTIGSVSGAPSSINQTNGSPEMTLLPGNWKISYGVPLGSVSTSTTALSTASSSGNSTVPGGTSSQFPWGLGIAAAVAVAGGAATLWRRRRSPGKIGGDLRPDDAQVLNFIQENGGKVLEPEIRMRFALPKTSAWRQIKRLERLGYVKVTKIGSQNQIEILRERKNEP